MRVHYHIRNFFIVLTLLLFAIALSSCEHHTYVGTLSVRGNAPFSRLILATDEGTHFELVGDTAQKLMSHQYARVVIAGKELAPAKGPRFPAQIEVIKIISISSK